MQSPFGAIAKQTDRTGGGWVQCPFGAKDKQTDRQTGRKNWQHLWCHYNLGRAEEIVIPLFPVE